MRQILFIILTAIVLSQLIACLGGGGYNLVIGKSCYAPRMPSPMAGWGENVPYHMEQGERLKYQGSYAEDPYGRVGMVRQFDRRTGWSYTTLDKPLPVDQGTLVEVQGTIAARERQSNGVGRNILVNRLKVEKHRIICETHSLQEQARNEYHSIRGKLQEKISLPGSRLRLSDDPDWRVDWLMGEDTIVVAAHVYDLMYAAEVQFLFYQEDQKLQAVYFYEWFKGE
jgi:hypothetical protein